MCGITGFVSFRGALGESALLRMNQELARRGPDGAGHLIDGPVGLAMRRLAVIDLHGGNQPLYNEDRSIAIVFNGEIYNYRELRADLVRRGHRFSTDSDTEVIVHLYEEHGLDAPAKLSGMFAFAIWDSRHRRVVLARDRLGIKPLYYAHDGDAFVFGSEIKAVLASGRVSRQLDLQAIDEYLAYTYVCSPRTIYSAVKQLAAGSTLVVDLDGRIAPRSYWQPPQPSPESASEREWVQRTEVALRDAVARHLVSDVPVGAFLSGGVDSGLMVALMADLVGPRVETFTVRFDDAGTSFIDETRYSRALAERYKLAYHELTVTPDFEAIAGDIAQAFDQPFADDSVIPTYYVCKAAREHVKVALTGLGGDELFGGYRRHLGLMLSDQYRRVPAWFRQHVVAPLAARLPDSSTSDDRIDHLKRFVRTGDRAASTYAGFLTAAPADVRRAIYTDETSARIDASATERCVSGTFDALRGAPSLEQALGTDLALYLPDDVLALSDRLSMWHSLELRVPYLDHQFVEFASRVPARLKIRGTSQKYLLKKVAENWLPEDMIRHKKQGFESPMGRWLRGPLLPFFDATVSRAALEATGLFRYDAVRQLRDEHVARKAKHSKILFSILSFVIWARHAA